MKEKAIHGDPVRSAALLAGALLTVQASSRLSKEAETMRRGGMGAASLAPPGATRG